MALADEVFLVACGLGSIDGNGDSVLLALCNRLRGESLRAGFACLASPTRGNVRSSPATSVLFQPAHVDGLLQNGDAVFALRAHQPAVEGGVTGDFQPVYETAKGHHNHIVVHVMVDQLTQGDPPATLIGVRRRAMVLIAVVTLSR